VPRTDWGWLITEPELRSWILFEDERLLVVNKPAHVVCHPSKHGEWSSLIGACRAYLGVTELHMPTRLDRETSGIVILVKDAATRRAIHRAGLAGQIQKRYHAVLRGSLMETFTVDQPIGLAQGGQVAARRTVDPENGQAAQTTFEPVYRSNGCTLAYVTPHTGRTHQIRVHANWLGLPIAGDKLYPDESVFLGFLKTGQPETRQALHASQWECASPDLYLLFQAPIPSEFQSWFLK
jgi:23S rRNA pseudouridine1911/1915/1917 synthase